MENADTPKRNKYKHFSLIFTVFIAFFIIVGFIFVIWKPDIGTFIGKNKSGTGIFIVNLIFQLILLSVGALLVNWKVVKWKPNLKDVSLLLFLVFILLLFANILLPYIIPPDSNKVESKILNLPTALILTAIILAPLSEEVFFRAALTKYMSPLIAALIFCLFHISYGSVYEVILVFLMGWLFGEYYVRTKNLGTLYVVHMLINAISIFIMGGLK